MSDTISKPRRGRPPLGLPTGHKVGIYLTQSRLDKLGSDPAKAIYALIDAAPPCPNNGVSFSIRLTPAELSSLGATDADTARDAILQTVGGLLKKKAK